MLGSVGIRVYPALVLLAFGGLGSGMSQLAHAVVRSLAQRCPAGVAAAHQLELDTATLRGIVAVSSRDVWAWGSVKTARPVSASFDNGNLVTLVEHFDGEAWCAVNTANWVDDNVTGVAAVSANDAWAVGGQPTKHGGGRPLIEHWNGQAWADVPSPPVAGADAGLAWVSASSASNVWSFGAYGFNAQSGNLVERWDGRTWKLMLEPAFQPSPYGPRANPTAMVTLSATDTWLVGVAEVSGPQPWAAHWDGRRWTDMVLPHALAPASYSPDLKATCEASSAAYLGLSIAAVRSDDVWVTGFQTPEQRGGSCPLAFQWDGTQWHEVWMAASAQDTRLLNRTYNSKWGWQFTGMAAVSSSDIWAMVDPQQFALHWDGRSWHVISAFVGPRTAQGYKVTSMSASGSGDVWALTDLDMAQPGTPWNALHWDGKHWRGVSILPVG